ncbi:MAG: HlyD family efflux transporter periplasmic adaptor subunit [Chloroflexi bacterium]|nr:HlyD family efflux transporter periplasmic adaptor subunit [Chloroflexota bacterium]
MDKESLFRKSALERLSTPEQLDTLMEVTLPQSWLVLLGTGVLLALALSWSIFERIPITVSAQGILLSTGTQVDETTLVISETSGSIDQVLVEVGQIVTPGQILLQIESEDGELIDVLSPLSGLVARIDVSSGDQVDVATLLVEIIEQRQPPENDIEVIAFVSVFEARGIRPGMPVEIQPLNIPQQEFGFLHGEVLTVGRFPANDVLAESFSEDGSPVLAVRIGLIEDEGAPSGYQWSIGRGPRDPLRVGVVATISIVIDEQRPIERVIPILGLE